MKDKKNIDKLFQERFSDYQVAPSEVVWENIEAALKEKKKRRIIPFWFKLSDVAAVLLLSLFLMNQFLSEDKIGNESISTIDSIPIKEPKAIDKRQIQNEIVEADEVGNSKINNTAPSFNQIIDKDASDVATSDPIVKNKSDLKNRSKSVVAHQTTNQKQSDQNGESESDLQWHNDKNNGNAANNGVVNNSNPKNGIKNNTITQNEKKLIITEPSSTEIQKISVIDDIKTDTTAVATVVPNALEELLNEKEVPTSKEQKLNRWQITSTVAPVYFSSTSNGSPLDSRFENNNKNYKPTVSYGIGAAYAVNKKLSIRAGISTVALEYNTNDIAISQSNAARKLENVSNNIKGNLIQIDNLPNTAPSSFDKPGTTQFGGSLNQKTGYIEVPVELSYRLVDQKFGVALIGGLSTLFLNQNEVAIVSSGLDMTIGEASNLNEVHFSTNLGIGVNYNFLSSFQLNFEPMFKYQINTYSSDSGNFKPYYFGLYTGISYKF